MGHMVPRDEDFTIDLENGASGEERNKELVSDTGQEKSVLGKNWGSLYGMMRDEEEEGVRSYDVASTSNLVATENANYLVEKHLGEEGMSLLEKKREKEKRKNSNSKKAPKPPRPPRGPSLDAADQKLVLEMSELAMLKRARLERMRAQKKKKKRGTKKSASSSSNLCALVITVLFILVIIFQGRLGSHVRW